MPMPTKTVRINPKPSMPPIKEEVVSNVIENYFERPPLLIKREKEVTNLPKVGKGGNTKKRKNKKKGKSIRR